MNLPIDKKLHILVGAVVASTLTAYGLSPLVAFFVSVTIGALKEAWDSLGNGTVDRYDFLATAVGACIIIPLLLF